ncbi:hypothetical protein PLICRDRAFT_172971 [Plicaturopsis crispa FD-325 SS-3]|nr:hypothetical protein PLICRDRAFT_172971 [Plicaturopsis crispa FD-325 SS-3]
MGQRHKAFVIARVLPHISEEDTTAKYRCVAAFHHQWCYGRLPLLATRRFLTLAKNNATIIRSEIRAIDGKYGKHIDDTPCPYIAFLLATAWTTDLSGDEAEAYTSGVSFFNDILSADSSSYGGVNDEGITILDVTDLARPAYCHISHNGCTPETADDYVRGQYPRPSATEMQNDNTRATEESILSIVASLAGEELVQLSSLAEAWPYEYGVTDGQQPTPAQAEEIIGRAHVPSLADLVVRPAVEHALQVGGIAELEHVLQIPGKHLLVEDFLRKQASFTDSAIALLVRVLVEEAEVQTAKAVLDLSSYNLLPGQIVQVVSEIKKTQDIDELNLSDNRNVNLQATQSVLAELPSLRRLLVLGATGLSGDDARDLIASLPASSHLEAIIHPSFLTAAEAADYDPAFSLISVSDRTGATCALPLFTPASIVQVLSDLLGPVAKSSIYKYASPLARPHSIGAAFSTLPRDADTKWADRRVWLLPKPSRKGLDGYGWTLLTDFKDLSINKYAFVRFEKGADPETTPPCEIHDLRSFLDTLEAEGRPAAPAWAVAKLEQIMATLTEEEPVDVESMSSNLDMSRPAAMQAVATRLFKFNAHRAQIKGATVMTRDDVEAFVEKVKGARI